MLPHQGESLTQLVREEVLKLQPYKPGKPSEEVKRELGVEDVLKLASNENPIGPSPKALEAIQAALKEVHIYPDGGCHSLKHALASHLKIGEENLILGNGSDEIIKIIAETFLNQGEEVICGDPTFSQYAWAARIMGARCVAVPMKNFHYDLEAISLKIRPRTKLIFLGNPNNPTGTMITRQEVDNLLKNIPPHVIVVFDEAYSEYVTSPDFPDTLAYVRSGAQVITLRTFSKIYGLAGLRIGYAVAPPEMVDYMNRARNPFNANSLAQAAALASLADHEHVKKSQKLVAEGIKYLYREFKRMGLSWVPTQANFVLLHVGVDSHELFRKMLQEGVIVRPCGIFGLRDYIRVTVGTWAQNSRMVRTLENCLASFSRGDKLHMEQAAAK